MNLSLLLARRAFLARRAMVYKQLSFALSKDAHPRTEFMALLSNARRRKSTLAPIYQEWCEQLGGKAAGKMALAMRRTIPASEYALLASAEETGRMKEGLHFMAKSVAQIEEMRVAIVNAFRSVILPVLLLVSLVWSTDAFFFPMVEGSLERKSWPYVTKLIANIAHDIGTITTFAAVLAPLLVGWWIYLLPRWTGPWRRVCERTVLFSKYRDYMCCLFLVNLHFLMDAGHPPRAALERMRSLSNRYMRSHIDTMLQHIVERSINVGDGILASGLFNEDLAEIMSNYARWSDWHRQIGSIAESALTLVTADVKRLGPLIQDLLHLTIGVCAMVVFAAGALVISKVLMVGMG
jgi:type II secretory pathway component PulF